MATEVFPVVHVSDSQQAVEQTGVALQAGADGVYLIDHGSGSESGLVEVFNDVDAAHPDSFIGLNFLQFSSGLETFLFLNQAKLNGKLSRLPDGVWVDNALPNRQELADLRKQDENLKAIRYLGGAAFKYTREYTDDPSEAAEAAVDMSQYVDVVTTSGPGTGKAPSPEKIESMKKAIVPQKLAVASGIDTDNVKDYAGNVDEILVASSIETHPYSGVFDVEKLEQFVKAARDIS